MDTKALNYTLLPQGEKDPLTSQQRKRWTPRRISQWAIPAILAVVVIVAFIITNTTHKARDEDWEHYSNLPACPQYPALVTISDDRRKVEREVLDKLSSDEFLEKSVKRMQGAIQIPTEVFDDMGEVGDDPRWDIFADFHEYLEKTFSLVYSKLEITKVNTYGILIEWKGKNQSLKPFLFMAHQDVVPVLAVTESRWKYPPYSAHYDGRYIWGRGGSDCKNVVIGVLEAFETLLENGFEPERTMMASFGFDEEISGWHGAFYLAKHLEDIKGRDSLELILDEGGGIKEMYGAMFALPGVGEKGYIDVKITVETAGGHSSIPPDHSGIGILSQIVSAVESNPYKPDLTPINPYFTTLQCAAEYGPTMSKSLRQTIQKSLTSKKAAKLAAETISDHDIYSRYLMQTSQAVDLISGGVKINALPEKVYAVVNHRIAVESGTNDVRSHLQSVIESQVLTNFSLSLDAWGDISGNTSSNSVGRVILEDFATPLEPSPVSPFDSEGYKTFTGTIKQVFGQDYIVAPSLMTGNTDTKYYWDLSRNIYRFNPIPDVEKSNIHTVDERIGIKEHVEGVKFYAQMVFNGDVS